MHDRGSADKEGPCLCVCGQTLDLSLRPADWRRVHFAALGGRFLISTDFKSPNLPAQLFSANVQFTYIHVYV